MAQSGGGCYMLQWWVWIASRNLLQQSPSTCVWQTQDIAVLWVDGEMQPIRRGSLSMCVKQMQKIGPTMTICTPLHCALHRQASSCVGVVALGFVSGRYERSVIEMWFVGKCRPDRGVPPRIYRA
eukprot:4528415-Amphidinium_carterae.1